MKEVGVMGLEAKGQGLQGVGVWGLDPPPPPYTNTPHGHQYTAWWPSAPICMICIAPIASSIICIAPSFPMVQEELAQSNRELQRGRE